MASREIPCTASSLLGPLLDDERRDLVEVARTRVSVHYETGHVSVPVLTVCTPAAVRLPGSIVTNTLPVGATQIGRRLLTAPGSSWRVTRWWTPPRPRGLTGPSAACPVELRSPMAQLGLPVVRPSYDGLDPTALVGAGPGLTPAGDDVLAAALVTAHATADPRLRSWQRATRRCLSEGRTTAVSRALLHHALDGFATSELDDYLTAVCTGRDLAAPTSRLLAVGHSSGAALAVGVRHTLDTCRMRGTA